MNAKSMRGTSGSGCDFTGRFSWPETALSIFIILAQGGFASAWAQNSMFTYQGRLFDGSQAATGTYDFQFRLTDAPTNGTYVSATLARTPISVTNGVFTVTLDFGPGAFDGSPRFLEAGVRTNGSTDVYSILQPLQPITMAPYAMLANSAVTAGFASNLVSGSVLSNVTISGNAIQPGTVTSTQIDPATDAAYRAFDTNAVFALVSQVVASNAAAPVDVPIDLARTTVPNVFSAINSNLSSVWYGGGNQKLMVDGDANVNLYSTAGGLQSLMMHRPTNTTFTIIGFTDDSEHATNADAYVGMAPDFANGGYFWVPVFDGFKQWDLFMVGKGNSRYPGRFAMGGAGGLKTNVQLNLGDVDSNITTSLAIYSRSNSILATSGSLFADTITIERLAVPGLAALAFHQGSGAEDWRIGMSTNGAYDLTFYSTHGAPASSPSNPGQVMLQLKRGSPDIIYSPFAFVSDTGFIGRIDASNLVSSSVITNLNISGCTIQAGTITAAQIDPGTDAAYRTVDTNVVKAIATQLWPSYVPTNTLAPLGGYGSWGAFTNYNGWLGVCFVAGSDDMLLKALGRYSVGGLTNKQHQVLVLNSDYTTNGAVTLPRNGKQGDFVWANCNIMVNAGSTNYLITDTGEGDYYLGTNTPAGWDNNINSIYSCYGSATNQVLDATNAMCGVINFLR